ncbi:MAG: hypothetical protein HQL68_03425 [Magnetococcales bacterium]|nr:hypothetical protein [Magnetococcales bacterium]
MKLIQFLHSLLAYDHPTSFRETFKSDRFFITLLLSSAMVLFVIASLVWNIELGRDWHRYFIYYFQFPANPNLFTLPGTPLILGTIAKGGFFAFYLFLFIAYPTAIFGVYYVARLFSQNMARLAAVFALGHLQLTYFHVRLNSDPLFVFACTLLAMALVRLYKQRDIFSYSIIGTLILLTAMVRPIGQLFAILFLVPIICYGFSNKNLILAGVIFSIVFGGFAGVAAYHYSEMGKFVVTEGGGGLIFRGAYLFSRVISPENGPASQRLKKLVDKLVTHPIYKDAGVTADMFFSDPNKYYYYDIVNSEPKSIESVNDHMEQIKFFSEVSKEGIKANPIKYIKGVYKNISFAFTRVLDPGPLPKPETDKTPAKAVTKKCKYSSPNCHLPTATTVASIRRAKNQAQASEEFKIRQERMNIYLIGIGDMFKSTPFSPPTNVDGYGAYIKYYLGEFARSLIYKYPSILYCAFASVLLLIGIKRKEIRLTILLLIPSIAAPSLSSFIDPIASYRIPHDLYIVIGALVGVSLVVQLILNTIGLQNHEEAL